MMRALVASLSAVAWLMATVNDAQARSPEAGRRVISPNVPIVLTDLVPGGRTSNDYSCITARQSVDLYARRDSSVVVAILKTGDAVRVTKHELHVWPTEVAVVFSHPPFKVGDKFYLLAYEEENFRRVWFRGAIDSRYEFIDEALSMQAEANCTKATKACWLRAGAEGHQSWWIEVRLSTNEVGWTNRPDLFTDHEEAVCSNKNSK